VAVPDRRHCHLRVAHGHRHRAAFDSLVGGLAVVEALVEALVPRLGDQTHDRLGALDELRTSFSPEPGEG
jgi:hypothetical protein